MRRFILAAVATFSCAASGAAQTYVRDLAAMEFFRDSVEYLEPFSGGMNAPMQQFHDVDGDGDLDLFVFDNDYYPETLFFRNNGDSLAPVFALEPGVGFTGAQFKFWYRFADYDGDGIVELLTDNGSTGVRVWRNDNTPSRPCLER
jgi:hypothetical protein